jgi:hypothetical protein
MTITVLIRRQRSDEPAAGTLRATVIQEGREGNILVRGTYGVEDTKSRAEAKLKKMFGTLADVKIHWRVDA